jgi:hypothetical protein
MVRVIVPVVVLLQTLVALVDSATLPLPHEAYTALAGRLGDTGS